jgi:hypothetical protein
LQPVVMNCKFFFANWTRNTFFTTWPTSFLHKNYSDLKLGVRL